MLCEEEEECLKCWAGRAGAKELRLGQKGYDCSDGRLLCIELTMRCSTWEIIEVGPGDGLL